MSDTVRTWFYPTEEQWSRWEAEMEDRGFETPNQFVQAMVEAGLKRFDVEVHPNETVNELREERKQLCQSVEELEKHYSNLEEHLAASDRGAVNRFLDENPDAEYDVVLDHVRESAPKRVTRYIDEWDGSYESPKSHDPRDDL